MNWTLPLSCAGMWKWKFAIELQTMMQSSNDSNTHTHVNKMMRWNIILIQIKHMYLLTRQNSKKRGISWYWCTTLRSEWVMSYPNATEHQQLMILTWKMQVSALNGIKIQNSQSGMWIQLPHQVNVSICSHAQHTCNQMGENEKHTIKNDTQSELLLFTGKDI